MDLSGVTTERSFKVCRGYEDKKINLPKRSTAYSAGYDFECAEDTVIPPTLNKPTLVPTGIKACMPTNEVLFLYNRSSNPLKRGLVLANSVGVIDSDYYGNPSNDGHIMFAFYNFSSKDILIKKGEKLGQGIFQQYLLANNDNAEGERIGGYGSTDL